MYSISSKKRGGECMKTLLTKLSSVVAVAGFLTFLVTPAAFAQTTITTGSSTTTISISNSGGTNVLSLGGTCRRAITSFSITGR